jgi:TonB family protein
VEKTGSSSLSLLLFGAWLGSVLLLSGIVIRQNLVVRRCLRRAAPIPVPPACLLLQPARIEVFAGKTVQTPTFAGFLRPRLYLPEDWETWPKDHLHSVLAHEMAHYRGHDVWVLALQTLAVILFGLNPLIWVLHNRLTHLRELRCDEVAIDQTGIRPVDYSRVLLAFVERQGSAPLPGLTGISFSENSCTISGRFNHVLSLSSGRDRGAPWHYAVPVLLGLAAVPLSGRWEFTQLPASLEIVAEKVAARPLERASAPSMATTRSAAPKKDRIAAPVEQAEKIITPVVNPDGSAPSVTPMEPTAPPSAVSSVPAIHAEQPPPAAMEEGHSAPPAPELHREPRAERAPELLKPMALTYPEIALQSRTEGDVEVQIYITRTGDVGGVKVVSGPVMFHEAARKAAWDSAWRPALRNGEAVDIWVAFPIRFSLR